MHSAFFPYLSFYWAHSILPSYIWRKSSVCFTTGPPSSHIDNKNETWFECHTRRWARLWQGGYIYPPSDTHNHAETEGGGSQTETQREKEKGRRHGWEQIVLLSRSVPWSSGSCLWLFFLLPFTVPQFIYASGEHGGGHSWPGMMHCCVFLQQTWRERGPEPYASQMSAVSISVRQTSHA